MKRTLDGPSVLHMVASGGLYGVERMLVGLLPALRGQGCAAALASLGPSSGPAAALAGVLPALDVPVHPAPMDARVSIRGLARLEAVLRTHRPDVVHLHGYKAVILGGALSLLKRIPTVATVHTEVRKTSGFAIQIRLEEIVLRRIARAVAVSEPIRLELEGRGVRPGRITVIPNGIIDPLAPGRGDTRPERIEPAEPVLAYAGRLVDGKDVRLLIDAVHRLRDEYPTLTLDIAGEGPLRPSLEARAAELGVDGAVRFLGFVDDIYAFLAGATAFVLPSRWEGMPISLLEAMALGLPTVASRVGSIPDVVAHGEEAVLVEPADFHALVDGIRTVLADPDRRDRMGRRGRHRFVSEFTADRTAARYLELYRTLLA